MGAYDAPVISSAELAIIEADIAVLQTNTADTGWINVASLLTTNWDITGSIVGSLFMRRIGYQVFLNGEISPSLAGTLPGTPRASGLTTITNNMQATWIASSPGGGQARSRGHCAFVNNAQALGNIRNPSAETLAIAVDWIGNWADTDRVEVMGTWSVLDVTVPSPLP